MQRIASQIVWQFSLPFLLLLPGFALAGNPAPEDYLASESFVLEVRYCECQATNADNIPADILPSFLKESRLLTVGISSEGKGFASSNELSIGYELKPVAGSPDQYQFNYAGNYTASNGGSAGAGELLLTQGQWVNLLGTRHEKDAGSQHSNVVVRVVKSGGS
ncbi:hypothetical protein [Marinobacter sp. S6332]|uniref:hypothetical protein n=1 Tax=Marinobacter sp. S6332 TaxID=2926403 RepID=UPI001FF41CC6|nr:hypothetical protein [Marinobacter sp. S6332]MCK0163020.1 hypothetical protein [Marinobacter sp. S6332]